MHGATGDVGTTPGPGSVALFLPSLANPGGAERVVVNLSKGLRARGYDVDIVSATVDGAFTDDIPSTVSVRQLPSVPVPAVSVVGTLPGLVRYLRTHDPDVLVSVMNHVNLVAIAACEIARTGTELIISDHNNPELLLDDRNPYHLKDRLIYRLAPHLYPRADHIIGVSKGVSESLARVTGIPQADITTIYNPVIDESLHRRRREEAPHPWIRDDDLQVVLGAKPEAQKNLSLLVRSFARIDREDRRLVIVGTGEQADDLRRLARRLGVDEHVDVHGFVQNIFAYMSGADLFVLSSHWEGLSTILIEALACGCPVVSTNCPSGPSEILRGGEYGRLVAVDDDAALASAMESTLSDPPDPDHLQARAEDFTVDAATDKYAELIES